MAQEIKCPKCGAEFELSVAISQEIESGIRQKYETEIEQLKKTQQSSISAKEKEYEDRLKVEKIKLEAAAKKKAIEDMGLEMSDLKEELAEKTRTIDDAHKEELELRKKLRAVEERNKNVDIEVSRKVDEERKQIAETVYNEAEERHRLKDAEKDKQLTDMKKQIDDLRRKAEQGSQQIQGEILELDLENRLRSKFPHDDIDPVEKGVKGADTLETVKTQIGRICGKILWESKRTKNWSDAWIQKIKDDQLAAKADIAVIVSEVLPKDVQQFDQINGVWVTDISSAINLAVALRTGIMQVARERELQVGKQGKMELVYNYLTGPEFKNRIEAIVGSFVTMKGGLDAEKRAMQKLWARREKEIERVIDNISGMHGDLEGIAGKALPAIKVLELPVDNSERELGEAQNA